MVELLNFLHFQVSKKLKESTVAYPSSTEMKMKIPVLKKQDWKFRSCKSNVFNGFNNLVRGYYRDFSVSNFRIDLSSSKKSEQLNGFFKTVEVREMLDREVYRAADMVFPLIAAFTEKASGYTEIAL